MGKVYSRYELPGWTAARVVRRAIPPNRCSARSRQGRAERDAKTALQELLRSRGKPTPRYQILKESGPAHRRNLLVGLMIDGRIASRLRGRTRKTAEQSATRKILQALRDLSTE